MVSTPKPDAPTSSWSVKYDAWNGVVEVSDGSTTVSYQYDGTGRRIVRNDGTTEQHYFYDDQQVVETRVPDGTGGLEPQYQYVWSQRYIDAPVLRDSFSGGVLQTGDRLYYLGDANYSVTAVVNNAGAVQEYYDYDAYGKVTMYDATWANPTTTSAVGNTLLFAGQDVDIATGLQYSRARWYSSVVGGFVSRDPLGFEAGDANIYRYAFGNPTNYTDPSGESPLLLALVAANIFALGNLAAGDCGLEVTSLEYWEELGKAALLGALLGIGNPLIAAPLGIGLGAVSAYQGYNSFQEGNYFIGTLQLAEGALSLVAGARALAGPLSRALGRAVPNSAVSRAKEIHGALDPRAQRARTTAVTETAEGKRIVSSSTRRLTPEQRRLLGPGEVEGVGVGHAEVTGVESARAQGLTPTGTAASRPICPDCATFLEREGVQPLSPLKPRAEGG